MCGLVGVAGDLEYKDEMTMKRLFMLDYFRGIDATGFAAIRKNGEAKIAKVDSNPLNLFEMASFKTALTGSTSRAFIGHNRATTVGANNTFNAHPFHYDHIIGAHNGTLDKESKARLEEAVGENFNVDSQALYAAIAKLGVAEAIALCGEGRDYQTGAWSLVWYDQNEGSLNFLRNKHRPMWYAFTEDGKKILFASEWQMIDAAVQMSINGYKMFAEKKAPHYRYFSTDENVHMKFDLEVLAKGSANRPKAKAKEVKGREPAPVVLPVTGQYPFQRSGTGGTGTTPTSRTPPGFHNPNSEDISILHKKNGITNVVHLFGDLGQPFAGFLDRHRFEQIAKYGCTWCGCDVNFLDAGVTVYDRQDIVMCPGCSGNAAPDSALATANVSRIFVRGATMDSLL